MPVERSLWTVYTSDSSTRTLVQPEASRIDRLRQECIRFNCRAKLIEAAAGVLAESDPQVTTHWYVAWLRRLETSRVRIRQEAQAIGGEQANRLPELQEFLARQADLDAKLGNVLQLGKTDPDSSCAGRPVDLWSDGLPAADVQEQGLVFTGVGPIELIRLPAFDPHLRQRWAAAALLIVCASIAALLLPHPGLRRLRHHALPLLGGGLGSVWWFCGTSSAFGLFLLALSLLGWLCLELSRWASSFPPFRLGTR